jgi:hypothetical protein
MRAGKLGSKLFQRAALEWVSVSCRNRMARRGLPRVREPFAQIVCLVVELVGALVRELDCEFETEFVCRFEIVCRTAVIAGARRILAMAHPLAG